MTTSQPASDPGTLLPPLWPWQSHFVHQIQLSQPFRPFFGTSKPPPAWMTTQKASPGHDQHFEPNSDLYRGRGLHRQSSPSRQPILHFAALFRSVGDPTLSTSTIITPASTSFVDHNRWQSLSCHRCYFRVTGTADQFTICLIGYVRISYSDHVHLFVPVFTQPANLSLHL